MDVLPPVAFGRSRPERGLSQWHEGVAVADDALTVFAVASDGSTDQWDGHNTPRGVLLRWFMPDDVDFPDYGFDVYRALVPDVPPLPFNDLNVPFVEGQPSWIYGAITLSCPAGLHFQPAQLPGWWRVIITAGSPVTVEFAEPAWLVNIVSAEDTVGLEVTGFSGGIERVRQRLGFPGESLTWRTRGLLRVEIQGEGSVSFIGAHLLEDKASWQHLVHLCLPVSDPGYACGPLGAASEADAARQRLPAGPASEWPTRFAAQFAELLPVLRRMATHAAAQTLPASPDPDAPIFEADERALVELAVLDPHVARIVGLAYDDQLGGQLNGREYVYKVTGAWRGTPMRYHAADGDVLSRAHADGLLTPAWNTQPPGLEVAFTSAVLDLEAVWSGAVGASWAVTDASGAVTTGILGPDERIAAGGAAVLQLKWPGAQPTLQSLAFTLRISRFGLLPGIVAAEPGPPPGPTTISVRISRRSPSVATAAALTWDTPRAADGTIPEGMPVGYQVGHRLLDPDPHAPTPPLPDGRLRSDLVADGGVIYPSSPEAAAPAGELYLDGLHTTLTPGWWGWWSRGVDLFGRISAPAPWTLAAVVDDAAPPRPLLVQAEYVQADAPTAITGRSVEATRWLAANPGTDGLVTRWRYGPEEADLTGDVDRFRLAARFPAPGSTGPGAYPDFPAGAPSGTPGTTRVLAEYGPLQIPVSGPVVDVTANPVLDVAVTQVTALPPNPLSLSSGQASSLCRLGMGTDGASSVFADGTLTINSASRRVVGNGDGPNVVLTVEHPPGTVVPTGPAKLAAPTGRLVTIEATVPTVTASGLRAGAGVVRWSGTAGTQLSLLVIARDGDIFTCAAGDAVPAAGDTLWWYPDWFGHVNGGDVGLAPTASDPARAQIAVRAARTGGPESAPSGPGTITAVDLTVPNPPTVTAIPFDPADRCAVLASAATPFHGRSRFTLTWTVQPGRKVIVWRALSDEICRLDLAEHDRDGRQHSFPNATWPPDVLADTTRRQRVLNELAALDTARAVSGTGRRDALQAAYDTLTIDTQVLLARQAYTSGAFTALTGEPLAGTSFEDEFDGRGHAHWLYRMTARTAAGIESAPTAPTPPICAPNVVAPAVPITLVALADEAGGAVVVRWQASPDADLHHYDLYASRTPLAAADLESATPALTHTPNPHQAAATVETTVALAPGDWCLWVRAVDAAGNRSAVSPMLSARSIVPRPKPPVWVSAVRLVTTIHLQWRHPDNVRLATLVERRAPGTDLWRPTTVSFLPRGQYSLEDRPSDLAIAWEYRLKVLDHLGQSAEEMPEISVPEQA